MNDTDKKYAPTSKQDLIPGVEVNIGGLIYTVPPLNFRQLEAHGDTIIQIASEAGASSFDRIKRMVPVVFAALSRNYPELTVDGVKDIIDMENYSRVFEAVTGVSGIMEALRKSGQAAITGEGKPGAVRAIA